ncbi:hypothetical protein SLEP1_g58817 [Rubroshorea leprosula]|uniref:RNase H type-1 domain-containing protein n=1 Tax=Rubroshorea leprosula TaxID=152421 RepID=A0AAV5MU56_9ROSI|nr:hypothetical protein SLEP1_g58817 [Rubroshorea leprosula]
MATTIGMPSSDHLSLPEHPFSRDLLRQNTPRAHYVTIIGLTEPRGCGQATWVRTSHVGALLRWTKPTRTIWRRINSKRKLKDIQQLHWRRLWENEQKSSLEVKMVHTRTTQRGSPPQGQGRGQPPSVNLVSQNVPIAAAQHQQVEGVEEHNPQYPNAVASDPVTAQLNAMQQQFGVFQLVLAQLLARDNLADPLIHLLNPAPLVAPQPAQQPTNSPVCSVAPTASQAQSHMPPLPQNPPQPVASDVSKRLDNIEKLMPQFETYDGTKDPDDHLHAFFSVMQAQNASDALMCKMFPSTLRGNARTWYHTLRPNSINAYAELATSFATKFSSRRLIKKTTPKLMRITQRDDESLKNYMNRFNDAMLEVNAFDEAVGITAVIQGLNHDRFRDNLIKHTPTTFDEVNQRSLKFIKVEECVLSKPQPPKEARTPAWREGGQSRKKFKPTQNRGPISVPKLDRPDSSAPETRPRPPSWTSFTILRSQILMQIKNKMELRRPAPLQSPAASRDHTRYYDFHQDHGHTTEDCHKQGQAQGSRAANNRDGVGYQQTPPPLPPPSRVIHMIIGGPEAGGTSSKQQKLYVREVRHHNAAQKRKIDGEDWKNQSVTFTSADFKGVVTPHNDPLVTSVIINNCEGNGETTATSILCSKVLQGAEQRYPIVEKAALAVIVTARKLRPYFQSHPIIVMTDQPLRQILQKPECSGRLIKWAVELGEFQIAFQQSFWSGHALKFNFEATNNVAEYEALLLGMRLAAELKVKRLQIYSDSQLLTKIPRAENEHADSLSKLASENSREAKSMYIEILNEPSFQTSGVMEISTDPDAPSWTDPIREYILNGTIPGDKQEEMKLRRKVSRYTLVGDILYKRSYSLPLLKCLTPYEAEYALKEVHEGVCGSHVGARTLAHKVHSRKKGGQKGNFTKKIEDEGRDLIEEMKSWRGEMQSLA